MARDALTLRDLGEDRLLELLLGELPQSPHVLLGPGDDCAVARAGRPGEVLLLKTDSVIEGVHYPAGERPSRVGRKALCRPLSDIAAMGATPSAALVTLLCTPDDPVSYWRAVYAGLASAARQHGLGIAGGELSSAPGRGVVVALTAWAAQGRLVRRDGGKPGDVLFVTGTLGGSRRRKHWAFEPRLVEGRWLARNRYASAMMDLSDGLARDLPRLAKACGCGFEMDPRALPRTRGCGVEEALRDGEDYELLLAVPPPKVAGLRRRWPQAFPGLPLTEIGRLVEGCAHSLGPGFDHFTKQPVTACP